MRLEYGRRRAALEDGIANRLGEWLEPVPSAAGLHLSARIRRAADAPRILAAARRHLPGVQPWSTFALRPRAAEGLTLGFGLADVPAIERALRALRQSLLKTAPRGKSQSG
jgi:GntR family transcriptional regulator/MocR family aminotransferase